MKNEITTSRLQKLKYIGISMLSVLFFGKLIFLLYTFNSGFDLSDEGMHLLMYKYPQEYPVTIHNYHYIVTALLPPALITVFNLRACWLISDIAGWLILFAGCISFLRSREIPISKATTILLFLLGTNALALSIHDRIIAYNAFSNLFMNVSAGLILIALSGQGFSQRHRLLIAGAYFFAALQLFIKPTASVGVAVLELILCIFFFKRKIGEVLLYAIIGSVIAIVAMFLFVLPPLKIWWPNYLQGVELAHTSGYGSILMLLHLYAVPTLEYLVFLLVANVPVFLLLKWLSTKKSFKGYASLLLLMGGHLVSCVILLFLLQLTSVTGFNLEILRETPSTFYSMVLLIPNTLVFQWLTGRIPFGELSPPALNIKSILVCFFLLALPYLTIFGAFSYLDISLYGHLLPLIALLFIIPYLFMKYKLLPELMAYYVVFTTLLCSYFFIRHYIVYPTRMLQPLYEQKMNIGNEESVLVDSASASFVINLKRKVNASGDFKYATQIGLQPGLVFFLGLKQPGNSYYISMSFSDDKEHTLESMNAAYNDYFYERNMKEIVQGPVIINAGVSEMDIAAIHKRMDEHRYYLSLVDSIYNPYLEREMHSNPSIKHPFTYIYIPTRTEN